MAKEGPGGDPNTDIKEATNNAVEAMGLIENAIILGDLREAHKEPIRSRLQKCVTVLETLETNTPQQLQCAELQRQVLHTLPTGASRQAFGHWLLQQHDEDKVESESAGTRLFS